MALGRSYEDENRIDEAKKAYQDCLNIIPHHEEAQNSLNFIRNKGNSAKQVIELNELTLPGKTLHYFINKHFVYSCLLSFFSFEYQEI